MSYTASTPARVSDNDAPSGDEPFTWILSLSKPYQYALFALFALYAPSAIGQGPLFEPYLQLLLFVSLVFGSLLVSTTNLAGPLRYTYHNYRVLIEKAHPLISLATAKVTAWTPLPFFVLALLPWFRTWFFMGIIPLTWQFVRGEHRQAVSDISNRIDECCANAEGVAKRALSGAAAAKEDIETLEKNLRASDFYNKSSAAWATLDQSQTSTKNVMQIQTARGPLASKAKSVTATVNSVMAYEAEAFRAAQKSHWLAYDIRNLVARIKTAAEEGRMKDVEKLMQDANQKFKTAEDESSKAATARGHTRTHARDVYLAWQVICEEYRRAIAETVRRTDIATTKAQAAVTSARNDKTAAEGDMLRAFDIAAAAMRNAQAAQYLRAADFFDVLPAAWVELDLFERAVDEATETAETVLAGVASAMAPPPPSQFNMNQFRSRALEVTGALEDLKNDTRRVKELFVTYQPAKSRVDSTRKAQKSYAQEAASLAIKVSLASRTAAYALAQATQLANQVEEDVAAARKAAIEGDVDTATDKAQKADEGVVSLVAATDNARKAKEDGEDELRAILMLT